ncbi:hypothetical protein Tco_0744942 [Tanacetum coccineum]|uniref:Protein FAR1-RELATED SEQUENCE n=1 Tax=Tanacetum coccineum TaxID=301880 RepID=A0ABQ5D7N3_9ASTR
MALRVEQGFRRESCQYLVSIVDTFHKVQCHLNVDQLQSKLDKDEFQEDGSMAAFWVVNNQFQKFINSKFTLDYDSQMTDTYFVEYTRLEVQHYQRYKLQRWVKLCSRCERTGHKDSIRRLKVQDDCSRSGNDTDADDADIRPHL